MKEIHIECAGAGKTYGIAKKAIESLADCPNDKKIYIITYTNFAVKQIYNEILNCIYYIPDNIILSTVHSFLLENIIYPFSFYIKGVPINTCSIETLPIDVKYRASRSKRLKGMGVIASSDVLSYAKSIIVDLKSDNKKINIKKQIIRDYFLSDIFCLFIDEAQDMNQDFFDIIDSFINDFSNFYIVGDPKQSIFGEDCYSKFVKRISTADGIEIINNFESRRLPQNIVKLCNYIIEKDIHISSINTLCGKMEYLNLSELSRNEIEMLSCEKKFTCIKERKGIFETSNETTHIPHEIKMMLIENFPNTDYDALTYSSKEIIENANSTYVGITNYLKKYKIKLLPYEYKTLESQFINYKEKNPIQTYSIQKIKGLENDNVIFIICNSLLQILLGLKNNYDKETNLLYVALTRTKCNLLLIIDDDKKMITDFKKANVNIDNALENIGIKKADKEYWLN